MKIGITCYPTYGGSGAVATELGKLLARREHEIHFISYSQPFRFSDDLLNTNYHEVEVTTYPLFKYPPYDLALACKMVEVVETYDLDLLHVHYAIPHAISAYLAKQMLGKCPIKFVTTLHGTDITIVGNDKSYFPVTRFGVDNSDGVTAVSDYLRVETRRIFKTDTDIHVIPNFVDTERFRPEPNPCLVDRVAPGGEKILLHMSNFRPVKRIPVVIEVFARVLPRVPAKLVLVGDGPERGPAEQLARDLGVSEHVLFVGKQDGVERFFQAADLFLLPSEFESFGLSALEAMSCGVPVIGARGGGLPELVTHEKDGFICDPGDSAQMAAHAIRLLESSDLQREMSHNSRQTAIERFEESAIVKAYETYYDSVLQGIC